MKRILAALVIAAFSTMTVGIAFADDPPKKEEKKKAKTKKAPKKKADEPKKQG